MVRRRQDVSREKGHLGCKGEFPGGICSLSSIICFGNTWVGSWGGIWGLFSVPRIQHPVNPWQHFISGADRKGKVSLQGLSFERCRQTSRSLRGLTDPRHLDALLLFMTAVPSNTDAPHIPKHPFAPPEWVTSCGCLWGCVRALYRWIVGPSILPTPALPIRVNTFPWLPHTHSYNLFALWATICRTENQLAKQNGIRPSKGSLKLPKRMNLNWCLRFTMWFWKKMAALRKSAMKFC